MKEKIKVGILGATGMVGQRFVTLLADHPYFEVVVVAASPSSAEKKYKESVDGRWLMKQDIPDNIGELEVKIVEDDMEEIVSEVRVVFSALDMDKQKIRDIEDAYAEKGIGVISNNSAHRWTEDVPMIMPEVNEHHTDLIDIQRKNRGWDKGFIAVKPNCSIQSYVPIISALEKFNPQEVIVTTLQSISGAGKNFETWPEMIDNVIPLIGGEEEKSEKEPMKVWGNISENKLEFADKPEISATCIRVPTTDGHMASVSVKFNKKPDLDKVIESVKNYDNPIKQYDLPSAPTNFVKYMEEEDRPQTKLNRDAENGMGVTVGRIREDNIWDMKFVALSHNTIRGAAGGAVLVAELLVAKGYCD